MARERGLMTISHPAPTRLQARPNGFPDTPLDSVSNHGSAQRARAGKPDLNASFVHYFAGRRPRTAARKTWRHCRRLYGNPWNAGFGRSWESRRCRYLSSLTVSFFLPRARRRASTARPFLVDMRVRKPCVLARFRLFG